MSRWKEFRYRLEELALLTVEWAVPRLSREHCVKLGILLGDLAYFCDARGRRVAQANLECVFGSAHSAGERRWIARLSYRNFVRTMLDLFWAERLRPHNYRQYVRITGFDAIREQMVREQRGVVFVCAHHGNWEWASFNSSFEGFQNTIVTATFHNPRLTEIFRRRRQASGQSIIAQENSMIKMLRIVKRGGSTGMLIDLNLRPSQAAVVIDGFGLKMCVASLHAILAQRAGALLVPVETEPAPDGTCRVTAYPPLEISPEAGIPAIAQACWDFFEPLLRARPELWLWPYKHFRFRPAEATRAYPFYANTSAAFDKLLRSQARGPGSPDFPGAFRGTAKQKSPRDARK